MRRMFRDVEREPEKVERLNKINQQNTGCTEEEYQKACLYWDDFFRSMEEANSLPDEIGEHDDADELPDEKDTKDDKNSEVALESAMDEMLYELQVDTMD